MVLWHNFKTFMLKESYDFGRSDINLFNFHPQLRIVYMMNGIFFENRDSLTRFILPATNSGVVMVSLAIQGILFYHAVSTEDYAIAAEAFCYLVILATVPNLYISMSYNRHLILSQVDKMNGDFIFIRSLGPRYSDKFISGQLIIWQVCWGWGIVCIFAGLIYIVNGFGRLLYHSLFATLDEHSVRPFIFPIWLPYDDPHRSPNYELFMVCELWIIFIMNLSFAGYVYLQFHTLLHYYNLMDMIILDLDVVFEGLDESVMKLAKYNPMRMEVQAMLNSRMKRIVEWHNAVFRSMDMVSSVFGPTLAYQVMFSGITICIVAYEIVVSIENGGLHVFFCIFWIEAILQLWIPCYLGTLVRDKALSIADACWNCGWQETALGRLICVDLVTVMLRSQKPLTIKFTGLPTLSLETFSSIMSTAYSYFNMLRQSSN